MKRIILLTATVISTLAQAQVSSTTLDYNNAAAAINDNGVLFHTLPGSASGYELPKGSMKHLIHACTFWMGGTDVGGQIKMMAQHPYSDGSDQDLWPGALTLNTAEAIQPNPFGQTIWEISQSEINDHILNYQDPGYTMPADIASWPAHGDVNQGMSQYIAPFTDTDGDGEYHPELGDYPCIKGDYAVFMILNDKQDVHASTADPIGIEMHVMFYQYATAGALDNTTFIDVDVYNRSTQTLLDTRFALVMDGDLGNPMDDLFGCDSTRNLMYYYNDALDEDNAGVTGYGSNPPSFGVVSLNRDMDACQTFDTGVQYTNPAQLMSLMAGLGSTGLPITDDEGNTVTFEYYDNPNDASGWSEWTVGNPSGDRRGLLSHDLGTLGYQGHYSFRYAVIFNQGTDNLESVNGLMAVCDEIRNFYETDITECAQEYLGVTDDLTSGGGLTVYPNPAQEFVTIKSADNLPCEVSVYDMSGKMLVHQHLSNGQGMVDLSGLSQGSYMLWVKNEQSIDSQLLMKR